MMNLLLTSVGRRTYMVNYFKEALRSNGLVHASNSVKTYAMEMADHYVITPLIYDNSYVDFLLDYCLKNDIKAIIPLFDIDLPVLARNKQKFAESLVKIIVSDFDFVQICNDKWLTYKYLRKNGFNTPTSFISLRKVIQALDRNEINYPLIVKPRWGMGSIGIFEAENTEELLVLYKKTLNSISRSYLKYESSHDLDKSIIIQEKLSGDEYGLDVFNNLEGNILACVPKKKLAMRAGETDSAVIINNDELSAIGENLSGISKHIGNLDVDCFLVNNKFYILEMNCRFGGQYPFSHLAGVNFPKVLIELLNLNKVSKELLQVNIGTVGVKDLVPKNVII
ncbi:ATP-grasp domain-containing protein [Macellibacteroides fermentans]|uniref:ATP-grasp domain-containing protein n=1 Tax=Macellibacteroides fermentans TaxID=879969 RepID=UPI00406C654F